MSVTNHDPIGVHRDDGLANRREASEKVEYRKHHMRVFLRL